MAVVNRALIGYYNDGVTVGLRATLPGYDALTDDSSGSGKFSFDSEWTDIVNIHQVSLISRSTGISTPPHAGVTIDGWKLTWASLGFKPFVEVRLLRSGVIYDDYMPNGANPSYPFGARGYIVDSEVNNLYVQGGISGDQLLTVVYNLAVAQP